MSTQLAQTAPPVAELGLDSIVVSALPRTLGTVDAPERYTVSAVFSRRPDPREIDGILAGATREHLAASGYPTIELTVSDRRLEIANTNLEELHAGLALVLADRLAAISVDVGVQRAELAARLRIDGERELGRIEQVERAAASVSFATSPMSR